MHAREVLNNACVMTELLDDLGGAPLSHDTIYQALGVGSEAIEIVAGTELRQAGSLSAVLRATGEPSCTVFLKKVTASMVAGKPWNDRRRVLLYIRNELRFYTEFAHLLGERGVRAPVLRHSVGENLDGLESYEEEPPPALLERCGALMFLEPLSQGYMQASPLTPAQARHVLVAAARLHAAAWESVPTLERAARRLQRHGGSFALSARNPKELRELPESWARFAAAFAPEPSMNVPEPRRERAATN